jgi:hypothetical protein
MTRKFGALDNTVSGSHSQREWEELVIAWGWRCFYCGKPVNENVEPIWDSLTKDHLIPLSRGGSDDIGNLVPACFNCNRLKGTMTVDEFREARPVFFTTEQNSRRQSYEVSGLPRGNQIQPLANEQNAEILPPEPRIEAPCTLHDVLKQWAAYASKMHSMNDGYPKERDAMWYEQRRRMLRAQADGVKRNQREEAGQLVLPMFGDGTERLPVMAEAVALAVSKGLHVTEPIRKAEA